MDSRQLGGRPRKEEGQRRTIALQFYVNAEERDTIVMASQAAGMESVAGFVRWHVLSAAQREHDARTQH